MLNCGFSKVSFPTQKQECCAPVVAVDLPCFCLPFHPRTCSCACSVWPGAWPPLPDPDHGSVLCVQHRNAAGLRALQAQAAAPRAALRVHVHLRHVLRGAVIHSVLRWEGAARGVQDRNGCSGKPSPMAVDVRFTYPIVSKHRSMHRCTPVNSNSNISR